MKSLFDVFKGKNKEELSEEKLSMPDNSNGTIAFIDGQFIVTPPKDQGCLAKIEANDARITLLLNDNVIQGTAEVSPDDKIEVLFNNKKAKKSLQVKVQPDGMAAYLAISFELGERVFLPSQPSCDFLSLKAETEPVFPEPWTEKEIKFALKQAGVVAGIDSEAVSQATASMPPSLLKAAKAVQPVPGQDAFIEYLFPQDAVLASVDQNDVLAVKHPAVAGKPGTKVTGEPIAVEDVADCDLLVGEGAALSSDGNQAVALVAGRPVVKNGEVWVEPQHMLDGPVTALKYPDGVVFKGNLIVSSIIEDGMNLEVGGNLLAKNGAVNATLTVGGSAEVNRSLIGTTLYSGRLHLAYEAIIDYSRKLQMQVKGLIDNSLQLKSKALSENKKLGEDKIINVLISSRFSDFFDNIAVLAENYKLAEKFLEPNIVKNLKIIVECQGHGPDKINQLAAFYNATVALIKEMKPACDNDSCSVVCHYAQNSRIESSGNINISGSGCYNSTLISRGGINIQGTPGIFRGGRAIAKDNITIKELGCPSSAAPTYVEVPADKKIEVGLIHAGAVLKVGERIYRNMQSLKSFELFIDKDGKMQALGLKAELDT